MAHIINSEAEKIQYVLGTLQNESNTTQGNPYHQKRPTIDNLLEINKSVNGTLRTVIKNQMLLQFKLEDILAIDEYEPKHEENDC